MSIQFWQYFRPAKLLLHTHNPSFYQTGITKDGYVITKIRPVAVIKGPPVSWEVWGKLSTRR